MVICYDSPKKLIEHPRTKEKIFDSRKPFEFIQGHARRSIKQEEERPGTLTCQKNFNSKKKMFSFLTQNKNKVSVLTHAII